MLRKANSYSIWGLIQDSIGMKTILGAMVLIISMILFMVNAVDQNYRGPAFLGSYVLWLTPVMLLFFFASVCLCKKNTRLALFLETIWGLYIVAVLMAFFAMAVQLTPFPRHDVFFNQLDLAIGFNQVPFLDWTYHHPIIGQVLMTLYKSLPFQMVFGPLLLAMLGARRSLDILFKTFLLTMLIGFLIYYFFPSTDPAGAYQNKYFSPVMYNVVFRFDRIHHYLPVKYIGGGLIGFPSFHVIWAIALSAAFRQFKYLFYPLVICNFLIVLSTVLLGWHFLADVFGGIALVLSGLWLAEKMSDARDISQLYPFFLTASKP